MLSVAVPVDNEEEHLLPLAEAITDSPQGRSASFEILFVDDGSTDHSPERPAGRASNEAEWPAQRPDSIKQSLDLGSDEPA